ncbi:MAG: SMC-Scp complex subunit ScpB [Thermoplasmata archaeon]|nr:MAG: SMC-Scp complex subunit ScpB [Thermoplasmata archaeon]
MEETRIIEAALFSAGAPLDLEALKEATDLPEKKIQDLLKQLMEEYSSRDTALEIARVGEKYAMQLKAEYAGHVTKFADMEIPIKVLKTAALIAYHQPIKQRDLFDMIGSKVYEHVKVLHELGLIRRREAGRTKMITTTERFSEYFGIASTDRAEIKKWLMEKLNIKIPEKEPESETTSSEENESVDDEKIDEDSETPSETENAEEGDEGGGGSDDDSADEKSMEQLA